MLFGLESKNNLITIIYTEIISFGFFLHFAVQKYLFQNEHIIGRRIIYIVLPIFNLLDGICDLHTLGLKNFLVEQNLKPDGKLKFF